MRPALQRRSVCGERMVLGGPPEASDFKKVWAEPLGDVLQRWLARSGLLRLSDRDRVWEAWQRELGPDAAHTSLLSLKGNVALFSVDSSALLSELKNFRKVELLEALQREVRTYFVRDIRLRLDKRQPDSDRPRQ
jgi:predicted nucleic acid-binding Zn ribbon protein